MALIRITPKNLFDSTQNHHSQISVAKAGSLAFVSGQVAWTEAEPCAPSSLAEQTALVIENLSRCLEALSAAPTDIAMMRLYIVDWEPSKGAAVFPQLGEFLGGAHPSMTGIGVQALAAPDLLIEIEMIVQVPEP